MINKKNLLFLSFLLLMVDTFSQTYAQEESTHSDEALFIRANQLYKNSDFKAAQETYLKIAHKNAQVFYNLGNCAFKQKLYGYALLYWRRAEERMSIWHRRELQDNIAHLKKEIAHDHTAKEAPENPFQALIIGIKHAKDAYFGFVRSLPLLLLQIVFLVLWIFLFLYLRYLYKRRRTGIITLFFMLIGISGTMLAMKYSTEAHTYAVVLVKRTDVLSGPGATYHRIGSLHEAQEVSVLSSSDDYEKIKTNHVIGWVHSADLGKI